MRKTTLFLTLAGFLLLSAGSALALNPGDLKPIKNPQINPVIFGAMTKDKCEKAVAKVADRLTKVEQYREAHMKAYNNLVDRITSLIARLKLKGYDATKLEGDFTVLKDKVQKFSDDYAVCKSKIEELKSWDCANKFSEFKDKLKANRQCLKTVHQDSKDIRGYYFSNIKPDIKAIRQQKVDNGTGSDTEAAE